MVGVVSEMKLRNLTDGDKLVGAYFIPLSQEPQSGLTFVLRTDGDPSTLSGRTPRLATIRGTALGAIDASRYFGRSAPRSNSTRCCISGQRPR